MIDVNGKGLDDARVSLVPLDGALMIAVDDGEDGCVSFAVTIPVAELRRLLAAIERTCTAEELPECLFESYPIKPR